MDTTDDSAPLPPSASVSSRGRVRKSRVVQMDGHAVLSENAYTVQGEKYVFTPKDQLQQQQSGAVQKRKREPSTPVASLQRNAKKSKSPSSVETERRLTRALSKTTPTPTTPIEDDVTSPQSPTPPPVTTSTSTPTPPPQTATSQTAPTSPTRARTRLSTGSLSRSKTLPIIFRSATSVSTTPTPTPKISKSATTTHEPEHKPARLKNRSLSERQRLANNTTIKEDTLERKAKEMNFLSFHLEAVEPFVDVGTKNTLLRHRNEIFGEQTQTTTPKNTTTATKQKLSNNSSLIIPERDIFVQEEWICGGEMRDYQLKGLAWLIWCYDNGINAILGDEMGLGKTLQTISLIAHLKFGRKLSGPCLVVCPLSVLSAWVTETKKWCPSLNILRLHSSDKAERERLKTSLLTNTHDTHVVVTTYEMLKNPSMCALWTRVVWRLVALDEGHMIKNPNSQVSHAVRNIHSCMSILLTGTPLQNNLSELWALLNFLSPHTFTTQVVFENAFDLTRGRVDKNVLSQAHHLLRLFMLRRLKSEVEQSLPSKTETIIMCPLSEMQIFWYTRLLLKDSALLRRLQTVDQTATAAQYKQLSNLLMQLRKCCDHPFLFPGAEADPSHTSLREIVKASGKLAVLDRLLVKLKAHNHRVVIFSQFTTLLDILDDYCNLRGIRYTRLDGSNNRVQRTINVNAFNAPASKLFVFLMSTRAGGLGINLQTADTVVLFDSDWNPQVDLQAMARVHRIGQTKHVHVYRLVSGGTVEERMVQRAQKKLFLDQMVNRGSTAHSDELSGLSTHEILETLKFGAEKIFDGGRKPPTDAELDIIISRTPTRNTVSQTSTTPTPTSPQTVLVTSEPAKEPTQQQIFELIDEDEPTSEPIDEDEPTTKRIDEDEPTNEPIDEDEPTTKPIDEDEPTIKPIDEDNPHAKPLDNPIDTSDEQPPAEETQTNKTTTQTTTPIVDHNEEPPTDLTLQDEQTNGGDANQIKKTWTSTSTIGTVSGSTVTQHENVSSTSPPCSPPAIKSEEQTNLISKTLTTLETTATTQRSVHRRVTFVDFAMDTDEKNSTTTLTTTTTTTPSATTLIAETAIPEPVATDAVLPPEIASHFRDGQVSAATFDPEQKMLALNSLYGKNFSDIPKSMGDINKEWKDMIAERKRSSTVEFKAGYGAGLVPVKKINSYDLDQGERSVFQQELNRSSLFDRLHGERQITPIATLTQLYGPNTLDRILSLIQSHKLQGEIVTKKDKNLYYRPLSASLARQVAGRDFDNQEFCLACWDGGELVLCDLCPMSFHKTCVGFDGECDDDDEGTSSKSSASSKRKRKFSSKKKHVVQQFSSSNKRFVCPHHTCLVCGRKSAASGGLLFRCSVCPAAYCEDCLPGDCRIVGSDPRLEELGYRLPATACYVHCSPQCDAYAINELDFGKQKEDDSCLLEPLQLDDDIPTEQNDEPLTSQLMQRALTFANPLPTPTSASGQPRAQKKLSDRTFTQVFNQLKDAPNTACPVEPNLERDVRAVLARDFVGEPVGNLKLKHYSPLLKQKWLTSTNSWKPEDVGAVLDVWVSRGFMRVVQGTRLTGSDFFAQGLLLEEIQEAADALNERLQTRAEALKSVHAQFIARILGHCYTSTVWIPQADRTAGHNGLTRLCSDFLKCVEPRHICGLFKDTDDNDTLLCVLDHLTEEGHIEPHPVHQSIPLHPTLPFSGSLPLIGHITIKDTPLVVKVGNERKEKNAKLVAHVQTAILDVLVAAKRRREGPSLCGGVVEARVCSRVPELQGKQYSDVVGESFVTTVQRLHQENKLVSRVYPEFVIDVNLPKSAAPDPSAASSDVVCIPDNASTTSTTIVLDDVASTSTVVLD